jgi:hypothetical protein
MTFIAMAYLALLLTAETADSFLAADYTKMRKVDFSSIADAYIVVFKRTAFGLSFLI